MHEARASAELVAADRSCPGADAVASNGALFADVVLVKGLPGPAEESGGAALSGADGEALDAALKALGYDQDRVFRTLSRSEPEADTDRCAVRLRLSIEAVDPSVIVALDPIAAQDVGRAFGVEAPVSGVPTRVLGRTLLATDAFEASLGDEREKRRVWAQLKSILRAAAAE